MKLRLALGASTAALVCALSAFSFTAVGSAQTTPGLTAACTTSSCLTQSITGTANGHRYDLQSTVTRFQNQRGSLLAVVETTGSVDGTALTTPIVTTVPVSSLHDSCTILDLTLGPLHLDLLGLVVDLNQVHLTATGQTGPGNLLGNLLCGVANALNGGQGGGIATLLNNLLGRNLLAGL